MTATITKLIFWTHSIKSKIKIYIYFQISTVHEEMSLDQDNERIV